MIWFTWLFYCVLLYFVVISCLILCCLVGFVWFGIGLLCDDVCFGIVCGDGVCCLFL